MHITAYQLAQRYVGIKEISGVIDNPIVMAMLKLDQDWPENDEVPWCSAFMNWICWNLRLPRSKSLMARSWLGVGEAVHTPKVGYDVAVFWRGERTGTLGHVGFFAGFDGSNIAVLGGNQNNEVNVSTYDASKLLGFRRLYSEQC